MFAWKQQFIQRVRNSSLVERQGIDNKRASSAPPKLRVLNTVGEHSGRGEGGARAKLERPEKQM
jgi:hypothetical protein